MINWPEMLSHVEDWADGFWAGAATDFGDYFSDVKNNTLAGSISAYSPEAGPLQRLVRVIVRAGLVLATVVATGLGLVLAYLLPSYFLP